MRAEPPITDDIVFHAQQAAEKSLKAVLSWHRIPFRKTHNLVELGEACCRIDKGLEPLLRRVAPLTEYAWKFRYPGDPAEPSAEEARGALTSGWVARGSKWVKVQGPIAPPLRFLPFTWTPPPDGCMRSRWGSSPHFRSSAQPARADCNKRRFSRSALIRNTQPCA